MKSFVSLAAVATAGILLVAPLSAQELLLHYNFDEAPSGNIPTIDHGTALPRVDGRFFLGATRTDNTPGNASIGALDVTQGGHILANKGSEAVASLDGKLDNLHQATVTLWVNLQNDPQNFDRIFSTGVGGVGLQIITPQVVDGVDPGPISARNFGLALDTYDGTIPSYAIFDADNKWVFLAVTFDGDRFDDQKVKFYSGGVESETVLARAVGTLAWDVTQTLPDHLMIGKHSSALNREIEGFVDDFRIYRGVLSQEELEAIRLENLVPVEPPAEKALLIHYNFDEASSGDEPTLDLGEVAPLVNGRFLSGATRTANTPGGASAGALDATAPTAWVIANEADLGGKLDNLTAFTTTLWVNLQQDPANLDRIFRAGSGAGFGYRIVTPSSGEISAANFGFTLDMGSGGLSSGIDIDADNKWVFLAVTFDGETDNVEFIVGGEDTAATIRATKTLTTASTGVLDNILSLGRHPTASRIMNGYLDDFRVYRGALSIDEIEAIRLENLGDTPPPAGFATWIAENFDAAEQADSAISGPNADPDGDGISNLLEYALGGNPKSAAREILPASGTDSSGYLTLTFVRSDEISDLEYLVETSNGLADWSSDAILVESVPTANGIRETYRAPNPIDQQERGFLRLRVEQK